MIFLTRMKENVAVKKSSLPLAILFTDWNIEGQNRLSNSVSGWDLVDQMLSTVVSLMGPSRHRGGDGGPSGRSTRSGQGEQLVAVNAFTRNMPGATPCPWFWSGYQRQPTLGP